MAKKILTVTRRLLLRGADPTAFVGAVTSLSGVDSVSVNPGSHSFTVTYHLEQVDLPRIEACLKDAGGTERPGLLDGLRLAWLRFTEQNLRDSALSEVRDCCSGNKPPGTAGS